MGFIFGAPKAPKAPKAQTVAAPQTKVEMGDVNSAKLAAATQRKKRGFASTNLDGMGGPSGIKQTLG